MLYLEEISTLCLVIEFYGLCNFILSSLLLLLQRFGLGGLDDLAGEVLFLPCVKVFTGWGHDGS